MPFKFTAFLPDPDAPRPDNVIHSNAGAQEHGFRGALVGGIHVYGWTTGAFVALLGPDWPGSGWVDVSFRKPTYHGDVMTVNEGGGEFTVTNPMAEICLEGKFGMGAAPFLSELAADTWAAPVPAMVTPPPLTLAAAPVGKPLRPMAVALSRTDHETFVSESLQDANPLYHGNHALCHPAWLAGRAIYLLHHSFTYGPAVHTSSRIQHLAPARAGQVFTVTGRCREAFEKNGHHYIVNDASIWSADRAELVRLRHTAIFRLRPRET